MFLAPVEDLSVVWRGHLISLQLNAFPAGWEVFQGLALQHELIRILDIGFQFSNSFTLTEHTGDLDQPAYKPSVVFPVFQRQFCDFQVSPEII